MYHRVNEISIKPKELGLYALKQNTVFKLCKEVYSPFPLNEKAWEISIKKKKRNTVSCFNNICYILISNYDPKIKFSI